MAENSTTPSTADQSEVDDNFEDATDLNDHSGPPSPQNATKNEPSETGTEEASSERPKSGESTASSFEDEAHVGNRDKKPNGDISTEPADETVEAAFPPRNESLPSEEQKSVKNKAAAIEPKEIPPRDASMKPPPRPSRFPGFTASLPSVPWGSGTAKSSESRSPEPQVAPQPATQGRKITAPFGWLSRATSGTAKDPRSPPLPAKGIAEARRNTAASISTLGSNQELTLKAIDEGHDGINGGRGLARTSLRERFKMLRMQEEVGVVIEDTEKGEPGSTSALGSPTSEKDVGPISPISPAPRRDSAATIDPNLAPGTVSGIAAAPSDAAVPIDWDFWQTVVNEGPQAVARTSPEELTQAIAGGIPSTIRGVIWQVLAGSKNEDLELVYQDLKVRGTKDEVKENPASVSAVSTQVEVKEKESVISSQSSVRSGHSTPATSANMGIASPSPSHESTDPMHSAKLEAQLAAEKAKKAKDDATALAKLEKMIKRDMGSRTSFSKYAAAAGFQDGLFNVCKSYALYDDAVGYPQGMNFIIMPLLFNMPEEEAFCLLVRLMNKYQLRELFVQDMPGLHLHLYQFERLLEDLEPALYCHLNRRGVTPKLYATQWFLTLFAYRFPLQLVMRVFDLVLCEGLEGAILKFGMALMQKNVDVLLAMNDMQALTNHLKEKVFDAYIDAAPSSKSILESGFFGNSGGSDNDIYRADLLVQDACAIKLTPDMLIRYSAEWEEKVKAEKARETELENLRTDTATKASQIRSLEKRAEKSDAEHIEIANELVKLKVENQDLVDQNESLTGQVEELRKVAESEAANVEERMRAGTEQVMQRNIEVQNENRHMEEQMAEMEKELVGIKMKYAELYDEHETLKQRWADLKKALG